MTDILRRYRDIDNVEYKRNIRKNICSILIWIDIFILGIFDTYVLYFYDRKIFSFFVVLDIIFVISLIGQIYFIIEDIYKYNGRFQEISNV